jgi:hypothetical protein
MTLCKALPDCGRRTRALDLGPWIGIASILLVAAGCASTPLAAAERDATAKSFATDGGQANVHVYRLSAAAGGVTYPVSLDGRRLGELAVGTFALAVVTPGTHSVLVEGKREASSSVTFEVEPGRNVFVRFEPRQNPWADFAWLWGGERWSLLLLVMTDPEVAMQEVRRCDLIQGTE